MVLHTYPSEELPGTTENSHRRTFGICLALLLRQGDSYGPAPLCLFVPPWEASECIVSTSLFCSPAPCWRGSEVRGDDRLRGAVRVVGVLAAPLGSGSVLAAASLFPGQCQEGDLLFEVDRRPYQAQLDQAQGQVYVYKAQLDLAKANYLRAQDVAKTPGAISQQD